MRFRSWALFVAAFVAGVPAAASSSSEPPPGPWRLFQLFEPVPGPQRGVDVWALETDLHAATKAGRNPAVTTLTFNLDERSGELRKTSYYTSEYNCSTGQTRTLRFRQIATGEPVKEDRTVEEWHPIIPHTFGARVLAFVCDAAGVGSLKAAADPSQALAIQRDMDRRFNEARASEQAEQARSN
jgi:hypothetical protein